MSEEQDTEFYFNGEKMSEEELIEALKESENYMIAEEARIQAEFGVSNNTASAILYLRSRSRWTDEKERELINRDLNGYPIPLGKVLSGEF